MLMSDKRHNIARSPVPGARSNLGSAQALYEDAMRDIDRAICEDKALDAKEADQGARKTER